MKLLNLLHLHLQHNYLIPILYLIPLYLTSSFEMSSSFSFSTSPNTTYQVFLSFRGTDTRNNFTSHLHSALHRKNIRTFIDNELDRGVEISPTLLKIIEEALISVVIFSENYANSSWCLDELEKMIECKKTMKQMVIPVFYRVDPSNVAEQKGSYGDAFVRHELRFSIAKQRRWKNALTEAANLSGWDSHVIRPESKLIEEIVEDIWKKLNNMSSSVQGSAQTCSNSESPFLQENSNIPRIQSSFWQAHSGTPRIESSFWQACPGIPKIQSSFWKTNGGI